MSSKDDFVKQEWARKKIKREEDYDAAKAGMHKVLQEAISNDAIREAVKDDLRNAKNNRSQFAPNTADFNLIKDDYDPLVDGQRDFVDEL